MAEEIRYLEKELYKMRERLYKLERKLLSVQTKIMGKSGHQRLENLKRELREQYPEIKFTPKTMRLLKLVGTLPYSPTKNDKELIAEAIEREYL